MSDRIHHHLTIVGGQPDEKRPKRQIDLPVGLEKLLYLAAQDKTVKADLLADRQDTIDRLGIRLRPSEAVTLQSVPNSALEAMIDRIRPENPKKRKIMRLVAATVTTLAAGTAVISCDEDGRNPTANAGGINPDTSVDGGGEDGGTGEK